MAPVRRGRGRPPGGRGRGNVAAAAAKIPRVDLSSDDEEEEVFAAGSSSLNNKLHQRDQVPGCSHWPDRPEE